MSKVETNTIVASSLDNFVVFTNDRFTQPYVLFNIGQPNGNFEIKIEDANNKDGYKKVLTGEENGKITNSTFNTTGDETQMALSLMECLKLNSIFNNIQLNTDREGSISIFANIESSTQYKISLWPSSDKSVGISGTYANYGARKPNKFVLMENAGDLGNITMQKYSTAGDVCFNVTSPFTHMARKTPIRVNLMAYKVANNVSSLEPITNNTIYVLPTTLSKFQSVNYADYMMYNSLNNKVKFLTNLNNKHYNYGEKVGLSLLTDSNNAGVIKKYYTNSGQFLESDTDIEYVERNDMRTDFYLSFDLDGVEKRNSIQVGFVDVIGMNGGVEVTEPVRYTVIPKCNENHEVFFVNELGGIDSFNFLGEYIYESKINSLTTYMINPTRPFEDTLELEYNQHKRNEITKTLTTTIINGDTAKWLNELSKSKYTFKYLGPDNPKFKMLIVDTMNIQVSDRNSTFEITLEYHDADNQVNI